MENFTIKHNILFFTDKEKDKTDAKLRLRIRWSKNVINFNVGYRVKLTQWDTSTQRCKVNTTNEKKQSAKEINSEIQKRETIVENIFKSYELKRDILSVEQFRIEFNNELSKSNGKLAIDPSKKTLFNYFDEFVAKESVNNSWTYSTLQKFKTVKNHLTQFDKELTFERFTKDGLSEYLYFLLDVRKMRNTTVLKHIKFLKWFLKWAVDLGHNTNLAFSSFSPNLKTNEKKIIFLDWSELMTVYNFDFSTAKWELEDGSTKDLDDVSKIALEKVRDVYCFCCFTSLRYSEVWNLKRNDILKNHISITTLKSIDSLLIDLNDYSRTILAKYANEVYPNNRALPVISNQNMNDHLKELGALCKLNTLITITYYKGSERIDEVYPKHALLSTHDGRRTFICNALSLGIPPQTVMKWTGHADYKSMKPYIDIADPEKKKAMNLFNTKTD